MCNRIANFLGMTDGLIYAKDLINVLKKKHEAKAYKTMVLNHTQLAIN